MATATQVQQTQTQTQTRSAWNTRAETLAEQRGARGTAHYLNACEYGHVYRVPSRTSLGSYDVLAHHDGQVACPCAAGVYGRPCCHAGAVLHAERQRTQAGDAWGAWDWWLDGGEW